VGGGRRNCLLRISELGREKIKRDKCTDYFFIFQLFQLKIQHKKERVKSEKERERERKRETSKRFLAAAEK